jgi:isopenicillin-N epimerase
MIDRRSMLASSLFAGAASALPASAFAAVGMPGADLFARNEDAYWAALRKQFLIPEGVVNLNNGTVGASPRPVLKAIYDSYELTEQMTQPGPEDYPIWGYGAWTDFRAPFAAMMGARTDQIAVLRNATEANNVVAGGFDMKPGEEVIITDEEHGSGEQPWVLRAKRYGIVVKKVALPKPARTPADILNRISDAITPQTRIIFVSHISTASGLVLPAKEIAALARSKGIVSAFDGAHAAGMMKVDLNDIGCDIYTGSMHKWLFATKGTGFLYVRDASVRERMWPTTVTGGWDAPGRDADRYAQIGSSNIPAMMGLNAAVALANSIGIERIEKRHRFLADYLHDQMIKRGAHDLTSPDPTMRCAIATVDMSPVQMHELMDWMWTHHRIRVRGGAPGRIRLSTPYYLQRHDIDNFLDKYDAFRKMKGMT